MAWRRLSFVSCSFGAMALLSFGLATRDAGAQTDEQKSGARAAATAGGQAYMDKKYAQAVDLFSRAESLVHSPVHLLYMARSYEKLGALVKAREAYIKIANEDLAPNAPGPYKEAKADAEKEQEALEPRVPYVSVVVQGAGPKPVTVTMDGVPVPPALLGVPRPVDPGDHRFEATAEGMDSAVSALGVREGHSETVVLTLHVNPNAPVAAPAAAPGSAQAAAPVGYAPGVAPAPAADAKGGGPPPLAWVAFGVGAVGLAVGTVFALKVSSKVSDADKLCHERGLDGAGDWCLPKASQLDDDARSARTVSIIGFAAGGIGVAAGVTLLVLSSHKDSSSARGVTPWVGLGSAGVNGRF